MNISPIFIHSLFRAGSTYLFNVFRRSPAGYWCYQESLHEIAVFAHDDPEQLIVGFSKDEMRLNRHPLMETPYFQEIYDAWPKWKNTLSASAIYNSYFAPPDADIGIPFWRALIDGSRGRPVFQECRTSGRIDAIRQHLNGHHIYLWRNPWDQWWSYKVTPYFDAANQLIINAPNSPSPVQVLRTALGLEAYAYSHDDLHGALADFFTKPLSAEKSYLVFYLLWCLGLQAGIKHAHLMLNIDRLTDSPEYRHEIQALLEETGIPGIDFTDCNVPQGFYLEQDKEFFCVLEDKVHVWLKEGGWSQDDIDQLQTIRQQFNPVSCSMAINDLNPKNAVEQASRARTLAIYFETKLARTSHEAAANVAAADSRATHAESRVKQAEVREAQVQARSKQAEARAAEAEVRAAEAEARAAEAEARATEAEHRIIGMLNSRSWRITVPLRWLGKSLILFGIGDKS
jgi:hypothetical protein